MLIAITLFQGKFIEYNSINIEVIQVIYIYGLSSAENSEECRMTKRINDVSTVDVDILQLKDLTIQVTT